jgi:CheY-like chemotaxis protein
MTMSEMDGTEVLGELRRRGSRVPALMSSGYRRDDFPAKVTDEDGVVIFIQKPYTIENLKSALDRVLVPVANRPS